MTTRSRNLALLVAVLVIAAVGFWYAGSTTPRASVLDAVPARSFLVATVDLRALRASPFGGKLGSLGESGIAEVKSRCGFDPLERARELAVCVPEEEAPGEFGVVARGDLETLEIAKCAEKLAEARGGATRVTESNGFTVVEDDSKERVASRIAMRPRGPLLVGAGRWLDTMMDVIQSGRGSVLSDEAHASLRAAVTTEITPAIVVTAILPKPLRERVKAQLGEETREHASAMEGVLGVAQIAASFDPGGPKTTLVAELRCETEDQCAAVASLIERKQRAAQADLRLKLVGAAAVLGDARVTRKGAVVRVTLSHDADDLARVVQRGLDVLSEAPPERDAGSLPQDEKLTAPRDASTDGHP